MKHKQVITYFAKTAATTLKLTETALRGASKLLTKLADAVHGYARA